ncbi:sigma-54-dependent Fis family transcriptional regulator [Solidesulfovibrio sp.]|uniref:sigma-54-dependent Fis family transcriptional regulator n=1 Tax=Solidesulfovibrio sp. TaxID=2910990 RepID=UPI002632ECDF|nr:sigma-54-dependent Fis family transcriptional regulator [Solidesulfovibrio sp.]
MRVEQVMHASPETLTPDHRVEDALAVYKRTGVNCVPILGPDGAPVGILTIFRVVDALKQGFGTDVAIREVMDPNIVSVRNDEQFEVVCHQMPMERLLVLNDQNRLVGVLTKMELIRKVYDAFDTAERRTHEMRQIIDCAMDGILVLDHEGREVSRNQRFAALAPGWSDDVAPDGDTPASAVAAGIRACLAGGTAFARLVDEDGGRRMVLTVSPLRDPDGVPSRYVATLRDLSEVDALRREADRKSREIEALRTSRFDDDPPVAESPSMVRLFQQAACVGRVDSTILITGETGVGKEVVAMRIHRHSPRRDGPLIQINCGAIPEHLQEAELFGYEKGAFTGADRAGRIGLFEVASGGTLMLDEVGEMGPGLQVKLLRALQEGVFHRIGGRAPIRVDVRVIAMTNRDLRRMVAEKTFREDLYYRLNVVPLAVPPLRERPEDVVPLAERFLAQFSRRLRRRIILTDAQRALLAAYPWPGNVRELANMMERLAVLSGMDESADPVWQSLATAVRPSLPPGPGTDHPLPGEGLREAVARFERGCLETALAAADSLRGAAKRLGVPHTTLLRKLREHGLSVRK